jgi:hypothetical protein
VLFDMTPRGGFGKDNGASPCNHGASHQVSGLAELSVFLQNLENTTGESYGLSGLEDYLEHCICCEFPISCYHNAGLT